MNLRRITNFFGLVLVLVLSAYTVQAQSGPQLAGINQDGLMQLGSNHPFVVNEYVIDTSPLGISTVNEAIAAFEIYESEGYMTFTHDMTSRKSTMIIRTNLMAHGAVSVADMNQRLRDIHKIKR